MFRVTEQMPSRARRERGAAFRYIILATAVSVGLIAAAIPARTPADDRAPTVAQAPMTAPQHQEPPAYGSPSANAPRGYFPPQDVAAANQAIADAARDAVADVNGVLWFFAGCALGVIGIVLGYVAEPSPPPARLVGKSPEYVYAYTQSYQHEGKQIQGHQALTGCLVGTLVTGVIYAAIVVTAVSRSSSGP